jgi:hypothetical protein
MFQTLEDISDEWFITFTKEESKHADFIIALYNNEPISIDDITDPVLLNIIGYYYQTFEDLENEYDEEAEAKDYELMKKCYLRAIHNPSHLGNVKAMFNLGYYYNTIPQGDDFDYDSMKKYYLMAISRGNVDAMIHLARYYYNIETNYDLMKSYYLMATEYPSHEDCFEAMLLLGDYYKNIEHNPDLTYKFYKMAIETYKHKMKFTSNDACMVCFQNKDLYKHKCGNHSLCLDCYFCLVYIKKDNKCPCCRL